MICEKIDLENIKINLESKDSEECIAELLEIIVKKNPTINRKEALNSLIAREDEMSTAIYPFVAIPHAVCKSIKKTTIAIGISPSGVIFENPNSSKKENVKVNVIFEILFEENDTVGRLHILRDILQIVSNSEFINQICLAKTSQEVLNLISSFEI